MAKKVNYVFDGELCHHGIKGQHWGDRRFQYEDGSWTPEGRERYSEGGGNERRKARITYSDQKYKADLKSKARQDKDTRAAKEERNRIKEKSKTDLLSRKKQGKLDRLNKKENAKLDKQGRPKFGKSTKNMSDEDLSKAINRLKLQAEYNKQYVLATQPNSALVKADRFFEGPTGKFVADLAVKTIPDIVKLAATKALEDKPTGLSDIEKREKESLIKKNLADAEQKKASATETYAKLTKNDYDWYWKNGKVAYRKK